jgi:hypothetical protein
VWVKKNPGTSPGRGVSVLDSRKSARCPSITCLSVSGFNFDNMSGFPPCATRKRDRFSRTIAAEMLNALASGKYNGQFKIGLAAAFTSRDIVIHSEDLQTHCHFPLPGSAGRRLSVLLVLCRIS